ncbi:MAG TPA: histidine phosphatase family protein [Beutenbergiaceae bacterium]|nr:histidine phosphatase family protein [Beutenbergiaceae bacterium]
MAARIVYLVRHGAADAWGQLTGEGHEQSRLIGQRLARLPIDVVWHSPLPRAVDSAAIIAAQMSRVLVDEAAELVDHVPFVPELEDLSPSWCGFFDGYSRSEADAGRQTAEGLVARFGTPNARGQRPTHEVAVTHAYPIAWLVRDALGAPPGRWLSLAGVANTGLTMIELNDWELPGIVMLNDMSHLPTELRWTGFPAGRQP